MPRAIAAGRLRGVSASRSVKTQKLSESSSASRSRAQPRSSTMRYSIKPLGVSRRRRIAPSENPRPLGTTWRNPPTVPSRSAIAKNVSGSRNWSSIAIENPRSTFEPRQAAETPSSSSRSAGSTSPAATTWNRYPSRSRRATDCRTFRIARPSSENPAGHTTASSPILIARSPRARTAGSRSPLTLRSATRQPRVWQTR